MAMLSFNAETVQPYEDFAPVPAGEYVACVTDSELKVTKNGLGQYLALTLSILDGPYVNRLIWDRVTLSNPNPKAVEIGQRQLSGLCHAVGVLNVQDSAQLHNIPVRAKVAVKDDPQYGPGNEIRGYKAITATAAPQPAQHQATAPRPTQAAPKTAAQAAPKPATAYPGQGPAPWAAKKPAAAAPTDGVDDDVPF